jgi:predicted transcriptional regulator
MILSPTQKDMLKRFGQFPRSIVYFTTIGVVGFALTTDRAIENLDVLESAGLIFKHKHHYKLTQAGRNYVDAKGHVVSEVPVRNSTATGIYTPPRWQVSDGGNEFLAIKSHGNSV